MASLKKKFQANLGSENTVFASEERRYETLLCEGLGCVKDDAARMRAQGRWALVRKAHEVEALSRPKITPLEIASMTLHSLLLLLLPQFVHGVNLRSAPAPSDTSLLIDLGTDDQRAPASFYHDPKSKLADIGSGELLNATPSFAVFSRVIVQELPYVRSFIKHYKQLGVRKFYFVSNMFEQHDRIEAYFRNLSTELSTHMVLHSVHETDADAALNDMQLFQLVREDFVIGVDVDEFWVLPHGTQSFQGLVESHPAADYRVQWVMVPNDELDGVQSRPYHGFRGANGKWMANVSMLQQIAVTPHKPLFADAFVQHETMEKAGELLHFWGRSFLDQLTKGLGQQLHNRAGEGLYEVRSMTQAGKIPERLQMLAFLMNQDRDIAVDVDTDLLQVDRRLEHIIASDFLQTNSSTLDEEAKKIHDLYIVFKKRLAEIMRTGEYPTYPEHGLEKVAPWLASLENSM